MMTKKFLLKMVGLTLVGSLVFGSCSKEQNPGGNTPVTPTVTDGTVQGTVTAEDDSPLADVKVTIGDLSAVTAADGTYKIAKVKQDKCTVLFQKSGFADVSISLTAASFKDGVATADAIMEVSCAAIEGVVYSGEDPMANVTVSLNDGAQKVVTAEDGAFRFENLVLADYKVEFSATGFPSIVKNITKSSFKAADNYVVTLTDINMTALEVLPSLTLAQLEAAAQDWSYNEFRGGRNGDDYPHFDWSTDFFYCYVGNSHIGWLEEQNEGTTVQIRNRQEDGDWDRPADLDNFDSYVFGRKAITADNCKMYLKVRTHGGLAKFGVMVVDPTLADPTAVRIGDVCEYDNDNYTNGDGDRPDFEYDLSAYIGKTIYVAIGIYRAETGDYWHQLVLRRIIFAKERPSDWGWCPGEELTTVGTNCHMTKEMVRSTMPITQTKQFTGISQIGGGRDNYAEAYGSWRAQSHLMGYWALVPVHKDTEPFPGEGFVIKTRSDASVSFTEPEAYIYAKMPIAAGCNQMTMRVRGFSVDNATWFRVVAIDEDCNVANLEAKEAVKGPDERNVLERVNDAYKMISEGGGADSPEDYTKLVFDLSSYNGKNVIIAVAIYKGEENGDENKLAFHSIVFE